MEKDTREDVINDILYNFKGHMMDKLFVVPYNGELPDSFGIKKLEGDLVDKLYTLRSLDGVIGAYAPVTPDELALLVEQKTILKTPELVMVTELGVDYPASLLLYSEFMDTVGIHDLERFLTEEGLITQQEKQKEEENTFMGVRNIQPGKGDENYTEIA